MCSALEPALIKRLVEHDALKKLVAFKSLAIISRLLDCHAADGEPIEPGAGELPVCVSGRWDTDGAANWAAALSCGGAGHCD